MSTYRVLHTSDWHIGKKIGHFSRLGEQKSFLIFLLEFIKNEKIDLLLIAGDVYDSKRPGFEEQKLINDFFYELSFTSCKWCVVITGNHDKRDYFNINKKILSKFNFFLVTGSEFSNQVIFLRDLCDVKFIIVCMPYINERLIVDQECRNIELQDDIFLKNLQKAYKDKISDIVKSLDEKYLNVPRIFVAHSFFSNISVISSIGNSPVLPVSIFDNIFFSYVALGHIHNFRKLRDNIAYSGSPIQYSFDEDVRKYVNVLFFSDGKLVEQSKVLLPIFGKLQFLQGSFSEIMDDLYKLKAKISYLCYLKIQLNEKVESKFEEQIYALVKSSLINIFDIYYNLVDSGEEVLKEGRSRLFSRDEILNRDEKYFFQEKLRKDVMSGFRRGNKFKEEELVALFEEVLLKGRAGEYEDK
ncbi:exonuclease subunit SbcD [Borrelia anserina]|uniref:Nuclease SbcCD subunit D n=2 Tax=Borrelia anserina TaxID=143 RepID=W5SPG9_BORAN|nr:exonuclease subunit SbcD [Borrelia anserina]AHH08802.1 Exonuclease sbcD [Borrelia anserina BA2]APR65245.1 nuclease SbcCD subunit D [Borrelia anserina Es]UPA07173.1 exonuclease subunit SbcD [Borrelia anserina]